MSNASAAKGKRWERELREGLRGTGLDVESLRLAGTEDEGDMVVRLMAPSDKGGLPDWGRIVVEAKNTARLDLAGFTGEALTEAGNYASHRVITRERILALAVVKRRGLGWKDAYVVTTVREFFGLD